VPGGFTRRDWLKASAGALPLILIGRNLRAASNPSVTILLYEGSDAIKLSGDPLKLGGDPFGDEPVVVKADGGDVVAGGKSLGDDVAVGPGVLFKGNRYGGKLVLKAESRTLKFYETLSLEDYLPGVVKAETYESWEPAAHEAQAVSARSYAMLRLKRGRAKGRDYDFVAGVQDKAYSGLCENEQIRGAVSATAGETLSFDGKTVEAVFHSCCGGMTESAEPVWGRDVPYLRSVTCDYCRDSQEYLWKKQLSEGEFLTPLQPLGVKGAGVKAIRALSKTMSKRVREFEIETGEGLFRVDGQKLRAAVGGTVIRSLRCRGDVIDSLIDFIGSGYGHGVGLCQWGAQGMALGGKSRREILPFYYAGARIERD